MWKILFVENHAENKAMRLVPEFFLLSEKALHDVKVSGL